MLSGHLILWCSFLLLPSIFPSIRDFSNESFVHIRWLNYWSFGFSISLSSEYSGLISLKINWFDLLALQGTFRHLLQHIQFEGIDSLAFCLLYGPAFTTVCDHWEDPNLDYVEFVGRVMPLIPILYLYTPSILSFPPSPLHPTSPKSSQSTKLGSLCYIAISH